MINLGWKVYKADVDEGSEGEEVKHPAFIKMERELI